MSILIRNNTIIDMFMSETDLAAIPDDASLISDADWEIMVEEAGSEAALIEQLGVTDARKEI